MKGGWPAGGPAGGWPGSLASRLLAGCGAIFREEMPAGHGPTSPAS